MADWRKAILDEFTPDVARLTLAADPDGLLVEEEISRQLQARGFEIMRYDDPVAFRFAYESKYRSRWDRKETCDLVVVWNGDARLPHDLLQTGRSLTFTLADMFPGLSVPVLSALDRADLTPLFRARAGSSLEPMGDNATKDFILRHVFGIAPELIRQPSDLLRILLRRHYQNQRIPETLDDRLISQLRHGGWFDEWPLEEIVPDRDAFFGFLQERWPVFLKQLAERLEAHAWTTPVEQISFYGMKYRGPAWLPFDHDDVRIYVDNLFLEGFLKAVTFENPAILNLNWLGVGIFQDPDADRKKRLESLLDKCAESLPEPDARHKEWLQFARLWGQLTRLASDPDYPLSASHSDSFRSLQHRLDPLFQAWMESRFGGLHNQPATPPVMVHHVPRAIARQVTGQTGNKAAMIVMDGLSLDQWLTIGEILRKQLPDLVFHEDAVFAWVPTLTSVSRQAIFSGKPPIFFPESIQTTAKEPDLWRQFWEEQGLTRQECGYEKGLGDEPLAGLEPLLCDHRTRVAGLVVDKADRIMHGMELGAAGMQASIRQWCNMGWLSGLIALCVSQNFDVYLTSDHGNVEAVGIGRLSEGLIADVRGERCRIYPDEGLQKRFHHEFSESLPWPGYGLPDGFHALLATQRSAFIAHGKRVVGHGGITIEPTFRTPINEM